MGLTNWGHHVEQEPSHSPEHLLCNPEQVTKPVQALLRLSSVQERKELRATQDWLPGFTEGGGHH